MLKLLCCFILLTLSACASPVAALTATPAPPSPTPQVKATSSSKSNVQRPTLPQARTAQPSATPLLQGGTANLGLIGQPESLNPITESNTALRELTPLLFDTLLHIDPHTAQLQPGLAESWEYSRDGREVTFHLPADLTWSNGTPLTAAAIAASLKATEHPALAAFSQINALDPQTLKLTFARIDCAAVTTLAQLPLIPAAQILNPIPIGSGPFRVVEWSENKRILTLTRNPNYHGSPPPLDGLTVRFLASDEAAIALSEGHFDLVGPIQAGGDEHNTITNHPLPNYLNLAYPAPHMLYLAINYAPRNEEPLSAEVRRALYLALDREAILAQTLNGDGQLLAGSLLPDHWAAQDNLSWPDYDPVEARRKLAQAGFRDSDNDGWLDQAGQRIDLSIRLNSDNPLHQNLGWLISSYYRDVGLFARAEGVSADNIIDDLFTHDFSLALYSWPLLPDPDQRMFWQASESSEGFGLNVTSYNNPKLDELLNRVVAAPGCEVADRAKVYDEIQKILVTERPVDFLLTPNRHLFATSRLHGLQPSPFAPFTWNVTEWYSQEK